MAAYIFAVIALQFVEHQAAKSGLQPLKAQNAAYDEQKADHHADTARQKPVQRIKTGDERILQIHASLLCSWRNKASMTPACNQRKGLPMTDYKAIIWDFGGVITSSPFEAFNRYEAAQGLPENFIRTLNATNPDTNAWARFERSAISADEFDAAFRSEALAAGHDVPGSDVLALLAGDIRAEMVVVLDGLKARNYRLACITNNVKTGNDDAPNPGMARSVEKAFSTLRAMPGLGASSLPVLTLLVMQARR